MKYLYGFIVAAILIASGNSLTLDKCGDGAKLPTAISIVGCAKKSTTCVIPGFSQPTIAYSINFTTPKILRDVILEARIDVKNIYLPHISNWKEYPTQGPSLPLKKNKTVTFSSKIHYVGYEWWLPKAKNESLEATATFKVKGINDKVLYCAKVPLKFRYCITDCPEIFEEYKDAKKPLNLPTYKPYFQKQSKLDKISSEYEKPLVVPAGVPPFEDQLNTRYEHVEELPTDSPIDHDQSETEFKHQDISLGYYKPSVVQPYVSPFEDQLVKKHKYHGSLHNTMEV